MFKNHEIRVQLAKRDSPSTTTSNIPEAGDLDPGRISVLVSNHTEQIAKLVGIGVAGTYALHTASQIVIHIAKVKIK